MLITLLQKWFERSAPPFWPDGGITAGDGKVYATEGCTKQCAEYNPTDDQWTQLVDTALRHDGGALVFKDDRLIILGGDCVDIEEYHNNDWNDSSNFLPDIFRDFIAFVVALPQ